LQELRVANAKLKKAQEKASSEAADYKRQLRARQSEDEIALQEKAEKEAEKDELIKKLTRENTINQLTKNFLALNYNSEEATKAAIAQYDGETDDLFDIQSKVQERLLTEQKNQWLASRPDLNVGVGKEEPTMTLEQFKTATMPQIVEFKQNFPETYKKYINS
jgi:5-formyltetrahydrofolate cyclo-ligase